MHNYTGLPLQTTTDSNDNNEMSTYMPTYYLQMSTIKTLLYYRSFQFTATFVIAHIHCLMLRLFSDVRHFSTVFTARQHS